MKKCLLLSLTIFATPATAIEISRVSFRNINIVSDSEGEAIVSGRSVPLIPGENTVPINRENGYVAILKAGKTIRFVCWQSEEYFPFHAAIQMATQEGIWSGNCIRIFSQVNGFEIRSSFYNTHDHNAGHYILNENFDNPASTDSRKHRSTFISGEEGSIPPANFITDRFGKKYSFSLESLPPGIFFIHTNKKTYVYRKIK